MKVKEYEKFVENNSKISVDNLTYSFIGLAGETGECMEWYKKAVFRSNPNFTNEMLKLELGDTLHYLTRIAIYFGWDLKELMDANVKKLNERDKK